MGFHPARQLKVLADPRLARRALGQFETPFDVALAMAEWATRGHAWRRLVEPGAGGLAFIRAVAALTPLPGEAWAVELDPVAAERARQAANQLGVAVRVVVGDFLDPDLYMGEGSFDVILCNPPYVRHHYLEPSYKLAVAERLGRWANMRVDRLSGTQVYFLLRALQLASPGARVAFITGSEWLQSRYGRPIRNFLSSTGFLRGLLVAAPGELVFDGVLSTACIVLLECNRKPGLPVKVGWNLSRAQLCDAARFGESETPGTEMMPHDALLRLETWTKPRTLSSGSGRLGDYFRARRGIATGANDFFVLAPQQVQFHGLSECVVPAVVSPRQLSGWSEVGLAEFRILEERGDRCWLVHCRESVDALPPPAAAYLRTGEDAGLRERYLCAHRSPWYVLEAVEPAPLLIPYMARRNFPCIRNRVGARHLNLFHGLYPREHLSHLAVDVIWRYLNTVEGAGGLLECSRAYADNLRKLEPRDLESVELPLDVCVQLC